MHRLRWVVTGSLLAAVAAAAFIAGIPAAPEASATTTSQDIASAGPLTHVYIGNELSCQVAHTGDTDLELYPPDAIPGDCGTFVVVGGTLYAPDFGAHDDTATGGLDDYTAFTPVSQTAVTGSGTAGDPYTVVTVADAGSSGIRITETDRYVVGDESYRTDLTVQNLGNASQDVSVYRAGDCYLGGSDTGYGTFDATTKAIGCTKTANNTPPGRIEVWSPVTPPQHYFESGYSDVWAAIGAKTSLPDTCDCATAEDNGAALEWDRTLGAGASAAISHLTTYSPLGKQPLVVTKTADAATAAASASDGYTITITNPNAADVTVTSVADTLPAGFAYTAGTSSGLTTSDPSVAAQVLTWSGSFVITGGGNGTLHFNVTVAADAGTYYNNAGATADGYDAVPTGDTAPITVGGSGTPVPTSTAAPTSTATATATCATATSTPAGVPTATDTPVPTATDTAVPTATNTPIVIELNGGSAPNWAPTNTPVVTETAPAVTRTVVATQTVEVTRTVAAMTQTPQVTATWAATSSPTETPTAVPTDTATATATATASPTATATACVPTETPTEAIRTHTPTETTNASTATPAVSTATTASGTPLSLSTVAGIAVGPGARGSVAGTRSLPNTGEGGGHATANWIVAIAALVMAAGSIVGAAAIRQRRR